ncbi:MAG TPA: purine-binding chemotaxis protein CheW [Leptolyngbyaceae cyanobacterium M33_DOE_097]|uniref:Purine-binding chemotaxis protein CheW n=1 Tax=Oscillatoriales cyanobacterium SpSt-418 TaxID=2282169 RepID=A0A7C3KHK7_9CYAN|nr:purine-binding chemotaxis protein CheW [Leptolyngbyaceae cyanobacterium M33_DOE_097]
MNNDSYLTFQLNQLRYGIPATTVQEIFFLPEVTAIADTPPGVLGVINLRGELIPVIGLYQHLGQPHLPLSLSDSMIVLQCQTQRIGMIVNQVDAVQAISPQQIQASLSHQLINNSQHDWVMGIATLESEIITLLNPEKLVQYYEVEKVLDQRAITKNGAVRNGLKHNSELISEPGLYTHFSFQEQQILRERTAALLAAIAEQDAADLMPLAVVGLGGEYFGFDLETVHEFTQIHRVTPVPCCPPHIVGNINLRGEIVTLINLNNVIDLPTTGARVNPQAVVVGLDQRVVGIAVDDIFDVMYIHPSQITAVPIAMHSDRDDYLQGVVPYQDRMMSIINLSKLLTSDVLVVNEEA